MNNVGILMMRLLDACNRLPDMGGDLWARGIEVIERKYGVDISLASFVPSGMIESEQPTATITIVPINEAV